MESKILKRVYVEYDNRLKCLRIQNSDEPLKLYSVVRNYCKVEPDGYVIAESWINESNLNEMLPMFPQLTKTQLRVILYFETDIFSGCRTVERAVNEIVGVFAGCDGVNATQLEIEILELEKMGILVNRECWGGEKRLSLNPEVNTRLRACGAKPFYMPKGRFRFGEILYPHAMCEETLFYNGEALKTLDDITEYLEPRNYDRLESYFNDRMKPLAFTVLLEGASGTGKTAFCREIARRTKRPLLSVDIATLRYSDYGKDEKSIRQVFEDYEDFSAIGQKPILFLDECDTLLTSRQSPDGQNSPLVNCLNTVTEIFMQELEHINGIVFMTTNHVEHIDKAIARRLMFQVHIGHPEREVQVKLWRSFFPYLTESEAEFAAETTNFTGGQILQVQKKAQLKEILHGSCSLNELMRFASSNGQINKRPNAEFMVR